MRYICLLFLLLFASPARTQVRSEGQKKAMNRAECVAYALANAPALRGVRLEDSLARLDNAIALAAWKPFFDLSGGLTNNWKQQVTLFPDFMNPGETNEVVLGQRWTANVGANVEQLIYSPEIIRDRNLQQGAVDEAALRIETAQLDTKAAVSTAFYEALRATERVALSRADIDRLERNLRDARLLYDNGLNDKVDYKRATIALNRARASLAAGLLVTDSRLAELKALMGYPAGEELTLEYDYAEYAAELLADSLSELEVRQRPEVRAVLVRQRQQDIATRYWRDAWRPTLSASAGYVFNYFGMNFGDLYNRKFPAGVVSLNVRLPLFNGGRRFRRVERNAVLRLSLDYELDELRQRIEREYAVADYSFRAARLNYLVAEENVALAREIYDVIVLQYREGIKPFLEVIIAENDLRSSQNLALNALIDALVARVERQRATATL